MLQKYNAFTNSNILFVYFEVKSIKTFKSFFPSQTEYARFENGRFVYRINRSPMCEYMINFIHKLKHLPEKYMMNSVLENFTILLVTVLSLPCFGRLSPEAGGEDWGGVGVEVGWEGESWEAPGPEPRQLTRL